MTRSGWTVLFGWHTKLKLEPIHSINQKDDANNAVYSERSRISLLFQFLERLEQVVISSGLETQSELA